MQEEEPTYFNEASRATNKDVGLSDEDEEEVEEEVNAHCNKRSVRVIQDEDSDVEMQEEVQIKH